MRSQPANEHIYIHTHIYMHGGQGNLNGGCDGVEEKS